MPKYRVTERSFINNAIVEAGDIVEYDPGPSGSVAANLEPVGKKKGATSPSDTASAGDGDATGDGALV